MLSLLFNNVCIFESDITTRGNGTISENIQYYLCGYMVHKNRKLKCKNCLATIKLDLEDFPATLTIEKLTLSKSKGRLNLASNNFFRLISLVESALMTFSITDNILMKGAFEEILKSVSNESLPKVGCDLHCEQFVCNSVYDYLLLRFKAIARRKKQERFEKEAALRHSKRKQSKS